MRIIIDATPVPGCEPLACAYFVAKLLKPVAYTLAHRTFALALGGRS